MDSSTKDWWKGAVFYQVYPRSFCDSNGDGIGDLPGITEKLEHIASLGVEGIWISPFFPSPMKDFGYDVSNFRDIDPLFGTLTDFDEMLSKAHSLGLKIIIDLVFSHTSDQHPWFQDSRKGGTHKDWYVWADPKADGGAPNNWVSLFGGSAWEFDEGRGQYYLHNFLTEQPDLNFHNPEVQQETLDIAEFWLARGVDGLRLDVVNFYFHDQELRDNPPRDETLGSATQFEGDDPYSAQQHVYDKSRPEMYGYLKRLRALMDRYPGSFTLGEIGDDHPYELAARYTDGTEHLHTTYNPHMMAGTQKELTAQLIREPIEALRAAGGDGWPSWAFSNHDVVRAASRWLPEGNGFGHNPAQAKMLIALLGCLRGSMFLYQGEELGLPEAQLSFEQLQDPWGKHLWPEWQGRDGCRTPMPWDQDQPHCGFSDYKAETWLPVPETHRALSVKQQMEDENSTLQFTQTFIQWRKRHDVLKHGEIEFVDMKQPHILAFYRYDETVRYLCVFNLSNSAAELSLPPGDEYENIYASTENKSLEILESYSLMIMRVI